MNKPVYWIALVLALHALDARGPESFAQRAAMIDRAHVTFALTLAAYVAWEASEWVGRITADDTVWSACTAAVIAVSGMAAACAKSRRLGFLPTMRSSTRWNSLFAPGRVTSPA